MISKDQLVSVLLGNDKTYTVPQRGMDCAPG